MNGYRSVPIPQPWKASGRSYRVIKVNGYIPSRGGKLEVLDLYEDEETGILTMNVTKFEEWMNK